MNQFGLRPSDIEYIKAVIRKFPEVEDILVFGSRAIGNYKDGSDIDLCLKGRGITVQILAQIKSLLQDEGPLPYQFDIVAYHLVETETLKKHIDSYGKSIHL